MALSSVPIPPDAARDQKAAKLAQTVHTWSWGTLKQAWGAFEKGTTYFITPNGYTVNAVFCSCPDYGLGHVCKHIRAVVRLDAEKITRPRPSCWTAGSEREPEAWSGGCDRHANADVF